MGDIRRRREIKCVDNFSRESKVKNNLLGLDINVRTITKLC